MRSCYRGQMRFYQDAPDVLTPIVWYFADDAEFLPFETAYCSSIWDSQKSNDGGPVGELGDRGGWYSGARPAWATAGGVPCGTPEQWGGAITLADATAGGP